MPDRKTSSIPVKPAAARSAASIVADDDGEVTVDNDSPKVRGAGWMRSCPGCQRGDARQDRTSDGTCAPTRRLTPISGGLLQLGQNLLDGRVRQRRPVVEDQGRH